jgi:hypothetical protein
VRALSGLLTVLVLLGLGGVAALWAGLVPKEISPLAPLSLEQRDQWFVDFKLAGLRRDPEACISVLDPSHIDASPVPDRPIEEGCGWTNAVGFSQVGGARLNANPLTCEMAAGVALWVMHEVQPAARAAFGQNVASIEEMGTYSCRDIAGRGRRSAHATANAIDISAFRLEDGRRISVLRHWKGEGAEADFLRRVYDRACRYFRVTLGPDYDAAHADHFHFDRSGVWACV